MDALSVSALISLLSKIFDGATDKVGEQLWDSLATIVRRVFGRRSTSAEAVRRLGERPGDADAIRTLAQALIIDASRDPRAAAQLRHWFAAAERVVADDQIVADPLGGPGRGNVGQRRDFYGDVRL